METPFSLLFNMPTTTQPQESTNIPSQPDPTTDPPNKKTKGRPRKKNPQRGMGVAQLERLRVQKMRKNSPQQLDFYYPTLNLPPQPVPDPIQSFPVHYGSPVNFYGMNLNVNGCGDGSLGCDQNVGFKRVENGGGFGFNDRVVGSGQVLVSNPYCVNDPIMRFVENSNNHKELSSVPNVLVSTLQQHDSSCCDLCFKMMLINGDQDVKHNGRRSNFSPQISTTNGPDFLGLNLDNNINFKRNKRNRSFSSRAARSAFHANHNLTEGMEVVAIHRKGNSMRGGGGVFMEYDFFPRSKNSDHINYGIMTSTASKKKELLGSSEASVAVGSGGVVGDGGEASCVTVCDYSSFQSSNSIDLSLKLSC